MSDYDNWLYSQIPEAYCTPKLVRMHYEPCDGEIQAEPEYNCQRCDDRECEHWLDFNAEPDYDPVLAAEEDEAAEVRAEMENEALWA